MSAVVASVLTLALMQQRPVPTSGEYLAEFSKLEDVWNQAHLNGDADALDRLWADNIVVIVPGMPPFSKPEALSVFRSARMKFERYTTSDLTVRQYDGRIGFNKTVIILMQFTTKVRSSRALSGSDFTMLHG